MLRKRWRYGQTINSVQQLLLRTYQRFVHVPRRAVWYRLRGNSCGSVIGGDGGVTEAGVWFLVWRGDAEAAPASMRCLLVGVVSS
ncbi:MAG: hypothetical protein GFH27_549305n2 [Chloroflexi bacterium AL-W]|nr:hypothetical protein [Chloroflexi bacterium AL-N1]NOK69248.1 hypothetical protein [Chloroflexi bacterium AL-N10]NOK76309.1 hypothetical protein [Chloroflexi bacterium AL-N5]NOK83426.1 hypothetical protein [Chloroflexi bacterium AL-W]NOK91086.1 hypothetical protein [Chloroflexi bacterium AL-N15]